MVYFSCRKVIARRVRRRLPINGGFGAIDQANPCLSDHQFVLKVIKNPAWYLSIYNDQSVTEITGRNFRNQVSISPYFPTIESKCQEKEIKFEFTTNHYEPFHIIQSG